MAQLLPEMLLMSHAKKQPLLLLTLNNGLQLEAVSPKNVQIMHPHCCTAPLGKNKFLHV